MDHSNFMRKVRFDRGHLLLLCRRWRRRQPFEVGKIKVEVIDVGTLMPFDAQPCVDSVLRTGRLVVLHEAQWSGGLGHTIQSRIMESAFYALEAAPVVIGALDTPVPFSPPLENHTIPDVAHVEAVLRAVSQD